MRTIKATLDNRIRLSIYDVPDNLDDALIEALCIPNKEREKALEQHIYGAEDMPEEIVMYGLTGVRDNAVIDIPRGFAADLVDGMEEAGVLIDFEDNRVKPTRFRLGSKISKREYQDPAVDAIMEHEQGIYKAPPGAGKTVTVLAAGRRAGTQCLIIVNTKDILRQWVNRIHEHLGEHLEVGIIGDNKLNITPYWNVATAQTIHSRYDELEEMGFFEMFGFVCLDECHHATADTYMKIMDRFSAQIRIGVSATPGKTGDFTLAQLVLGPVIHSTGHKELVEAGHLIKPKIIRVKTDFGFQFRGTTSRYSRSNYPEMVEAIIDNRRRNTAIINAIMRNEGHHCLVLTKRHNHIDILEAMLWQAGWPHEIARLTGKQNNAEREHAIELLESEPCCVFSTVADEAIDVPRMDRGFLVFPQRNEGLIEQQVGRFARPHPDKIDSIIYDFADVKVGALKAQWRIRWMKVYKKLGLVVEKHDIEEYV